MYSSESCVTDTPVGDPPTSISPPIINGETSTGVYSATSATNNNVIFRCPQGKVFQDSWKLYRDSSDEYARVEDEAYAVHNGTSWLDGAGVLVINGPFPMNILHYKNYVLRNRVNLCLSLIQIKK